MEKERLSGLLSFRKLQYDSKASALSLLSDLSFIQKEQMADVYRKAFGGPPWFEACQCPNCNQFSPDTSCRTQNCGTTNLPEAYPTPWLIDTYFPKMVTDFYPGVLILAENESNEVVGFATGGFTDLKSLVDKKYDGNMQIFKSIINITGLSTDEPIFYENEACVGPQRKGIGTQLNEARLNEAVTIGAKMVCGRSVNQSWLNTKRSQFKKAGFDMVQFTPEGDSYTVPSTGVKREFFLSTKINR